MSAVLNRRIKFFIKIMRERKGRNQMRLMITTICTFQSHSGANFFYVGIVDEAQEADNQFSGLMISQQSTINGNLERASIGANNNSRVNNEKQSNFPPYLPHCFRSIDKDWDERRLCMRLKAHSSKNKEGWTKHVFYEPPNFRNSNENS